MPSTRPALPVTQHYAIAVAAFPHALDHVRAEGAREGLDAMWTSWVTRLDDAQLARSLDDSWFFLPHVRRFLFPEFTRPGGVPPELQLESARSLRNCPLPRLVRELPADSVVRVTLAERFTRAIGELSIVGRPGDPHGPANCRIDWVDLVLFPGGVGAILLRLVALPAGAATVTTSDVGSLLSKIRWIHPPQLNATVAEWRLQRPDVVAPPFAARDLVDYLLQGLQRGPAWCADPIRPDPLAWLANLPSREGHRFSATEEGETFTDRFHFYSYCAVDQATGDRAVAPVPADDAAGFGNRWRQCLYELVTGRDSTSPAYRLSPEGAQEFEGGLHSQWRSWSAAMYDGSVAYLATEDCDFVRSTFPSIVASDYLNLYLLAVLERTWIRRMMGRLVRRDFHAIRNLRDSRCLWQQYIEFRNKFSFVEVTLRPQGRNLRKRLNAALGVDELMQELSDEVAVLKEHFETLTERYTAATLGVIGFVALPLGILAQLFGYTELFGRRSWWTFAIAAFVVVLASGILWQLLFGRVFAGSRRDDS